MPDSLQARKYQYGAGVMTVTYPPSGNFGAVNVESLLKHRENKGFLKEKFWFAVFDGHHHSS